MIGTPNGSRLFPRRGLLLKEKEGWTDPRSAVSQAGAVLCACRWSAYSHFSQKL